MKHVKGHISNCLLCESNSRDYEKKETARHKTVHKFLNLPTSVDNSGLGGRKTRRFILCMLSVLATTQAVILPWKCHVQTPFHHAVRQNNEQSVILVNVPLARSLHNWNLALPFRILFADLLWLATCVPANGFTIKALHTFNMLPLPILFKPIKSKIW